MTLEWSTPGLVSRHGPPPGKNYCLRFLGGLFKGSRVVDGIIVREVTLHPLTGVQVDFSRPTDAVHFLDIHELLCCTCLGRLARAGITALGAAGGAGFEPALPEPKSGVLPLDDPPRGKE